MRENELTIFGKFLIVLVIGLAATAALANAASGRVAHSAAFVVVLAGVGPFLLAKLRVMRRGIRMSFGTAPMTEMEANLYRSGYWLMAVGFLLTFLP